MIGFFFTGYYVFALRKARAIESGAIGTDAGQPGAGETGAGETGPA